MPKHTSLPFWHFFNRHESGKKISGFAKKRSRQTFVTMDLRLWLCYLPLPSHPKYMSGCLFHSWEDHLEFSCFP